jgi:hypothetical protein
MSPCKPNPAKDKSTAPASPKKPAAEVKPAVEKKAAPEKKPAVEKKAAPKKVTPKKTIKAVAKAKPEKKAVKPKATKKIRKPKTKSSKKSASAGALTNYEKWAAEAVAALASSEKEFVSLSKIKQYILDYFEKASPKSAAKLATTALVLLQTKKLVKSKKGSWAFTPKGKDTIGSQKVEKRAKVSRPEPKKPKAKKVEEAPVKTVVTISGRTSRSVY